MTPGTTAYLGVRFELEPGWHVYWHGRSDSGGPIELKLGLPAGFEAHPTHWPVPTRHISEGEILDHVYEGSVTLIVPVRAPASATGAMTVTADVTYVICNTACVFESAKLSLTVPVVAAGAEAPAMSKDAKLFEATRARLPRIAPTGAEAPTIRRERGRAVITAPGAANVTFFPYNDCIGLVDLIKTGRGSGPTLTLKLDPESDAKLRVVGVVEATYADGRGTVWYEVGEPRPEKDDVVGGRGGAEQQRKNPRRKRGTSRLIPRAAD